VTMLDEMEERRSQITDRFLQSTFGLWNALLTVNGILFAAIFAIGATSKEDSITFSVLIGACFLSIALLVYNFVATKVTYYRIGQIVNDENYNISEKKQKRDICQALFRHTFIQISEFACLFLLLIEAVLIIAMVTG